MRGAFIHTVVYVAVNGLLIALWVLDGRGSSDDAARALGSLETAKQLGFWPLWVMLTWGTAVVINWAAAVAGIRHRRRRRERKLERQARRRGIAGSTESFAPEPRETRRRWLAVMFTDLVNSTVLTEHLGDDAWADSLRNHRDFVRGKIARHGGVEVGTQGDGFLIRFPDPDAAVACAVELQRSSAKRRSSQPDTPKLRVGIHAGEVVHDGDDDDLVGRVVNLASRVTQVADPDEVLVTEAVADHLVREVALTDRGLHQLKGIERPRHLLSVVWGEPPTVLDLDHRDHLHDRIVNPGTGA